MSECLFCRIAAGEIPANLVYADEHVVAFRDLRPEAPSHVLIVPRQHVASLAEAGAGEGELLGRVLLAAGEVARREGVADSGYRLVLNTGPDAGQVVMHLHFHLLGGRGLGWPPG